MENKNNMSFILIIIAVILGSSLFKHFDFGNMRFQKPWLDAIYFVTFIVTIYFLIRNYINKDQNNNRK